MGRRKDTSGAAKRAVITGIGAISSIGTGKDDFWNNLVQGRSGIGEVERFDTSRFAVKRAGEIKGFRPESFMPKSVLKKVGRGSQLAIAAAQLALRDGGFDPKKAPKDIGVIIGTTMGEAPSIEVIDRFWTEKGEEDVYASNVMKFPVNNLSDNVGYFFGFNGDNCVIPTACAAGNYSIGFAHDLIRQGRRTVLLAGGADPLSRLAFTGFNRLFAMASERCQPFDKNRKGMMVGEGGALVIVEELEHARKRKATIYAEIAGYGLSCDAFNMTIPSERGIAKAIKKALTHGSVSPEEVDYISAHGTGTRPNDKTETAAVKSVFGESVKSLSMSSIKSMLGHTMGTASAFEAIACCLAIRDGILPPTINYETPDPECDIDCVPNQAKRKKVSVALNNSFAFGGNNACLVLKNYSG